jgi:peptide-methionine (R)-S-oxide reductase
MMSRRKMLAGWLGSLVAAGGFVRAQTPRSIAELQRTWREYLSPNAFVAEGAESLSYSDQIWRDRLTPAEFHVLREEGTEAPFSSSLNDEYRRGVYVCVGCDLPLFTSAMKYDSGTGWPSFFTTIDGAFEKTRSLFSVFLGTEYHCVRCGGHHGHLFGDGPAPTHERWCNNGIALRFIPKDF